MARTWREEPWDVALRRYGVSYAFCGAYRGIMRGRKFASKVRQGSMRTKERQAIALRNEEAFPAYKHGQVFWDIW